MIRLQGLVGVFIGFGALVICGFVLYNWLMVRKHLKGGAHFWGTTFWSAQSLDEQGLKYRRRFNVAVVAGWLWYALAYLLVGPSE